MLMTVLFYAALAFMWYVAYWMTRMQRLVVRHRRETIERLGAVTLALPDSTRDDMHAENMWLLERQERELLAMRPFWRRKT